MSGKRFVILTASEQLPAKLAVASLPEVEMLGEQFTNQLTLSVVNVFPFDFGKAKGHLESCHFKAVFHSARSGGHGHGHRRKRIRNLRLTKRLLKNGRGHLMRPCLQLGLGNPRNEGMVQGRMGTCAASSHSSQMKMRSKSTGTNLI